MKRFLLGLLLALILILAPVSAVLAATSADVTVTVVPSYISIVNAPNTYNFGAVTAGTTPNTGANYFTINNSSSVATNILIHAGSWNGTTPWTWGAAGANTGKMAASDNDTAYNVDIAATGVSYNLTDNLGASTNQTWELQLVAPNSFTHGYTQTTVITIMAVAK